MNTVKTFEEMGKVELRAACKAAGIKNYGKMDNAGMRMALKLADMTKLEAKPAKGGLVDIVSTQLNQPEVEVKNNTSKQKVEREERNGVKRPSVGGLCRAVWDMLDQIAFENSGIPNLKIAKKNAGERDLHMTTTTIQYYRWKKFNGY